MQRRTKEWVKPTAEVANDRDPDLLQRARQHKLRMCGHLMRPKPNLTTNVIEGEAEEARPKNFVAGQHHLMDRGEFEDQSQASGPGPRTAEKSRAGMNSIQA